MPSRAMPAMGAVGLAVMGPTALWRWCATRPLLQPCAERRLPCTGPRPQVEDLEVIIPAAISAAGWGYCTRAWGGYAYL